MKLSRLFPLALGALALAVVVGFGALPAHAKKDTYKVFVSVGFEGNTWSSNKRSSLMSR